MAKYPETYNLQTNQWVSGPQSLPEDQTAQNLLKLGAGVGAIALFGSFRFKPNRRGFDYLAQGVRALEEYSPGQVFRTFQLSHMLSALEDISLQSRYFSPDIIRSLQRSPVGRAWLDHISRLVGRSITSPDIMTMGFRFEGGRLYVGQHGAQVLLERASIIRSPTGATPAFQFGYMRSLKGGPLAYIPGGLRASAADVEVKFAKKVASFPISYINTKGEVVQDVMMFAGGKGRLQATQRWLTGYGTSLIERMNQLARTPFETEPFASILKKAPIFKRIGLGVVPSSGLKTLGKLAAKLGIGGTALYYAYQSLDQVFRESSLFNQTILGEGLTVGLATMWTKGQMALSTLADWTGLHRLREYQEEVAPGSTSLQKLLAFPLMGLIGGSAISYLGRVQNIARFQLAGLDISQASLAASAENRFFRKEVFGTAIPEKALTGIEGRSLQLVQEQASKKAAGIYGKIARTLGGETSWIRRRFRTPSAIRGTFGTLLGLGLVLPFIPGALVPSERPEELEALYSGKKQVPIRKGRRWELGRSAYEGERITRFSPHWYSSLRTRAKEKAIWGEHPPGFFERWWIENTGYELEKKFYYSRPYPVSGSFGSEIPLIGPLISATVGRLIKPPIIMHQEAFLRQGEGGRPEYLRMPFGYGERPEIPELGEVSPGAPISPYGIKGVIGEQLYKVGEEAIGLPGFIGSSIKERITGTPSFFEQEMQLQSAGNIYSSSRDFWDRELGGMMFTNELLRRLYPHTRRSLPQYNPIPNEFYGSWLPGPGEKAPNLWTGDPYIQVQSGEERLPGEGYAARFPDLKGVPVNQYPLIHRYNILADIAPYSQQYIDTLHQVRAGIARGQFNKEEIEWIREIQRQVQQKKKRKEFDPYLYNEGTPTFYSQILEKSKKEKRPSSLLGSYWETLAHSAETSFEFLTPVSPASKLIHMRTAIEDYERTQLYGTGSSFWQHPIRDFFRPFWESLKHSMGFEGIPEHIQEKRDLNEYFDILKYVKNTRLKRVAQAAHDEDAVKEYEQQRRETLFGINPYTYNYSQLYRSLPRSDRDYFKDFSETRDLEERAEILKSVPEDQRKLYEARWKLADAEDIRKAIKKDLLSDKEKEIAEQELEVLRREGKYEGMPRSEELWQEYLATRQKGESYADWYRRTYLLVKELAGRVLPSPDWVGWCFLSKQKILTYDYVFKNIENIENGELLLIQGKPNRVIKKYEREVNEEIVKVFTRVKKRQLSLSGTGNHKVLVLKPLSCNKKRVIGHRENNTQGCLPRANKICQSCENRTVDFKPAWTELKNIQRGDFLASKRPKMNKIIPVIDVSTFLNKESKFLHRDDIEVWWYWNEKKYAIKRYIKVDYKLGYLLGIYAAEGNLNKRGAKSFHKIAFTHHLNEGLYSERVQQYIHEVFGYSFGVRAYIRKRDTGDCLTTEITSEILAKLFKVFVGEHCERKALTYSTWLLREEFAKGFLAGCLCGDASKTEKSRIRLTITSERLCLQVRQVLSSFGIGTTFKVTPKKGKKTQYCIDFYTGNTQLFYDNLLNRIVTNTPHKTKMRTSFATNDYLFYKVEGVEKEIYNGKVYDLSMEYPATYESVYCLCHNSPIVSLDDIKLKVVENHGENTFDYDIWPEQIRAATRRPYLAEAAREIDQPAGRQSRRETEERIRDLLATYNIQNPQVVITEMGNLPNDEVNITLEEDRSEELKQFIRKRGLT